MNNQDEGRDTSKLEDDPISVSVENIKIEWLKSDERRLVGAGVDYALALLEIAGDANIDEDVTLENTALSLTASHLRSLRKVLTMIEDRHLHGIPF